MTAWTPPARAELERYLEQVRASLADSDVDPGEVIEDLRRHLEEAAETAQLPIVTDGDVRRWVAKLGPVKGADSGVKPATPPPTLPASPNPGTAQPAPAPSIWLLLLGVVLPAITLVIELGTGMCAATFFDPMPTWYHVLWVAWVPIVNLVTWANLENLNARRLWWLGWLNAIGIGIATYYAVLYFPLMLPGMVAVIYFGLGLLPWTPVLGLVGTVGLRRHLRHRARAISAPQLSGGLRGVLLGLLAVGMINAPVWITRWGLAAVASHDSERQLQGLGWLRVLGNEDVLLRECYGRTRRAAEFDLYGLFFTGGERVAVEDARRAYYRVTGRPFNSVPPPRIRTVGGQALDLSRWTWDEDQGGERVGGRLTGLTLVGSQLDAVIDPHGAVGYTEWMLEFHNTSPNAQEARAQIQLPPGGVVSRLTLWVNGEEREAAFGGRSQVRQAYQRVAIVQRRDPVLVTTSGPDRILMQCFPVPANGGTIKVRFGVSAPLVITGASEGALRWPAFIERNFTIPVTFRHSVWAESLGELASPSETLRPDNSQPELYCLRGQVREAELTAADFVVRVRRSSEVTRVAASLDRDGLPVRVIQDLTSEARRSDGPLVVVIDGSRGMDRHVSDLAEVLGEFQASQSLTVFHAGDRTTEIDVSSARSLRRGLTSQRYAGGLDNVDALVQAWDAAAGVTNGTLLWVHLPKPALFESLSPLTQRYQRRPNGPRLVLFPVEPGPNRHLDGLKGLATVRQAPRIGSVVEDLHSWLATFSGDQPEWYFQRRLLSPEDPIISLPEASSHVVRLWAFGEINRLAQRRQTEQATGLANQFQLVTTVSGAVVLETDAQYQASGLEPVSGDSVPSISVPDGGATGLMLLLAVAGLLGWKLRPRMIAAEMRALRNPR